MWHLVRGCSFKLAFVCLLLIMLSCGECVWPSIYSVTSWPQCAKRNCFLRLSLSYCLPYVRHDTLPSLPCKSPQPPEDLSLVALTITSSSNLVLKTWYLISIPFKQSPTKQTETLIVACDEKLFGLRDTAWNSHIRRFCDSPEYQWMGTWFVNDCIWLEWRQSERMSRPQGIASCCGESMRKELCVRVHIFWWIR